MRGTLENHGVLFAVLQTRCDTHANQITELKHDVARLQRSLQAPRVASHRGEGSLPSVETSATFDLDSLERAETSVRMQAGPAPVELGSFVLQAQEDHAVVVHEEAPATTTSTRPTRLQHDILATLHAHEKETNTVMPAVTGCTKHVDQWHKALLSLDDAHVLLQKHHDATNDKLEALHEEVRAFREVRNPCSGTSAPQRLLSVLRSPRQ